VQALQKQKSDAQTSWAIEVVVLEDFLRGPHCVSGADSDLLDALSRWQGLVNRVSDAAEPWEVKACLAMLQLAKLFRVHIWNGPEAYALCTHKWCHHILFQRAKLKSPFTILGLQEQPPQREFDLEGQAVQMIYEMEQDATSMHSASGDTKNKSTLDYLIKPSAGGFGAGIERRTFDKKSDNNGSNQIDPSSISKAETPVKHSDPLVLFQKYHPPHDGKIYRVWFLRSKVQCAVVRSVDTESDSNVNNELTSGCVGEVCQRSKASAIKTALPMILPWPIPADVHNEIQEQLLPALPEDAHCGSVEFLYGSDTSERLYFDLNLLSTLPVEQNDGDGGDEDPWDELATDILNYCQLPVKGQ
jgi:hypothetical protein